MTATRDNMRSVIDQYGFLPEAFGPAYMVLGNEFEQALKTLFPADNIPPIKVYNKVFEPYSFDKIDAEIIGNIIVANLVFPTTLLIPVNNGSMHYILLKIIIPTDLRNSSSIEIIDSRNKPEAKFYNIKEDQNLKIRDLALSAVRRALNITDPKKISTQITYRGNQPINDGVTCSYQVVREIMAQQKKHHTLDEVKLLFARAVTGYCDALTLQHIDVGDRIHKVVALRSCIADNSYLECYKKSLIAGRDLGICTAHPAVQTLRSVIVAAQPRGELTHVSALRNAHPCANDVIPDIESRSTMSNLTPPVIASSPVTTATKESFWAQHPSIPAAITMGAALAGMGLLCAKQKKSSRLPLMLGGVGASIAASYSVYRLFSQKKSVKTVQQLPSIVMRKT